MLFMVANQKLTTEVAPTGQAAAAAGYSRDAFRADAPQKLATEVAPTVLPVKAVRR
jgi:hypothetical protein